MHRVVDSDAPVNIKVFISYCHESAEHDGAVQTLAYHLSREGLDCVFDRQHAHEPPEGWMRWMAKHLRAADFVLVVCTRTYDECAQGTEAPGREARFDPVLTYSYLAFETTVRAKCIPIFFREADRAFIPRPLKPLQSFNVSTKSGFAALHSALSGRPPKENPHTETLPADLSEALWLQVYDALRDIAREQRLRWQGEETLNTTGLVHETYLRLVGDQQIDPQNRDHFLRLAAHAMRQILIDHAKAKKRQKRGGNQQRVAFEEALNHLISGLNITEEETDELIGLDAALEKLAALNPQQAQVVECRFFGGMSVEETAALLGISIETVQRDWKWARAWLLREVRRKKLDADA